MNDFITHDRKNLITERLQWYTVIVRHFFLSDAEWHLSLKAVNEGHLLNLCKSRVGKYVLPSYKSVKFIVKEGWALF